MVDNINNIDYYKAVVIYTHKLFFVLILEQTNHVDCVAIMHTYRRNQTLHNNNYHIKQYCGPSYLHHNQH